MRKKILVIDDEPMMRVVVSQCLKEQYLNPTIPVSNIFAVSKNNHLSLTMSPPISAVAEI